jgi:hypothetical protein
MYCNDLALQKYLKKVVILFSKRCKTFQLGSNKLQKWQNYVTIAKIIISLKPSYGIANNAKEFIECNAKSQNTYTDIALLCHRIANIVQI